MTTVTAIAIVGAKRIREENAVEVFDASTHPRISRMNGQLNREKMTQDSTCKCFEYNFYLLDTKACQKYKPRSNGIRF